MIHASASNRNPRNTSSPSPSSLKSGSKVNSSQTGLGLLLCLISSQCPSLRTIFFSLAYLFDCTLEASLLVLHPVHLSEGASAQAGLLRGPVDLLSVLIIHWLQFLGLAGEKRQVSVARAAESYSEQGSPVGGPYWVAGAEPSQPKTPPGQGQNSAGEGRQHPERGLWE